MPILTPSHLPPPPVIASISPSASSNVTYTSGEVSRISTPPTSPEQDALTERLDTPPKRERERVLKIPSVQLEMLAIHDDMAASLAVALLGHVLFLKSQVPFPVAQLGRVPGGASSASRAAKKRTDMIDAFDALSSHLHTTFTALSTALARNPAHRGADTVFLALVLGPTIGAPKARVVLALEGLEVKVWGRREDVEEARPSSDGLRNDEEEEEHGDEDGGDDDDEDEDGRDDSDDGRDEAEGSPSWPPSSSSSSSHPYLAPTPAHTYAEEQQALRAAERLLARTLVNVHAEGGGMAAELGPTQTHVLLRAPRRFSHPAWLPRQNVSSSLDNMLRDFLVDSGLGDAAACASTSTGGVGKARRRAAAGGIKTEGVLVTCQTCPNDSPSLVLAPTTEVREEDELIWWAWDGKLIGFAEW
ncbi:hypothetical protein F5148DRAFT_973137 [Russula earlei]|uniref:Uncharacterized protein n=1 Tax=Russula earlei TaxID=71964 RepID=A0ACC0UM55_9AGAM|nr:hypothetical protein F5148DRAFT_973137 [Russula earlei]